MPKSKRSPKRPGRKSSSGEKALAITTAKLKKQRNLFTRACLKTVKENKQKLASKELTNVKKILKELFEMQFHEEVPKACKIGGQVRKSAEEKEKEKEQRAILKKLSEEVPAYVKQVLEKKIQLVQGALELGEVKKPQLPSRNLVFSAQQTNDDIRKHIESLKTRLPPNIKAVSNLIAYIEDGQADEAISESGIELKEIISELQEGASSSSRLPKSKRNQQLSRVTSALRSGRWR
mmetsp:Transcript_451/g.1107  ORF Transcript_451/g.1107 Transcript_451/m.1107 type:complete len:235 (-) Transcript_451:294-998(-)|eukprot:CAMPEP_0114511064 /NCGR_PEP_ID=MMETSP0109-20121206/14147_1 /TAXON_ID=29199 /ORGANISM="Chlorarachnion reptans, Strain CCCM449" /LENGTH=234 /DNA_ID=CAMNT_0001690465 /DNA_START=157 /DNA_END=861 /DNA_ORIENTATION=-